MVRAPTFRAIGGFEPIRGEMADDLALARLLKSKRLSCRLSLRARVSHVRIYKGNRHAFWAMTKNVLIGIEGRLWLAPVVMVLPIFAFWTPLYCLVAGVIEADESLTLARCSRLSDSLMPRCGPAAVLFPFHPWKALLYPLVVIPVFCCMARASTSIWSAARSRGGVGRSASAVAGLINRTACETAGVASLDRDRVD